MKLIKVNHQFWIIYESGKCILFCPLFSLKISININYYFTICFFITKDMDDIEEMIHFRIINKNPSNF